MYSKHRQCGLISTTVLLVVMVGATGAAQGTTPPHASGRSALGIGLPPITDQMRYRTDLGLPATEQVVT